MRVVIADDHALVRRGLRNLLEAHGVAVAGEAHDGREAVTARAPDGSPAMGRAQTAGAGKQ